MRLPDSTDPILADLLNGVPGSKETLLTEIRPWVKVVVAFAARRTSVRSADDSDLTQETLMAISNCIGPATAAGGADASFRGRTTAEFAAWATMIARRIVLGQAVYEQRQRRDTRREVSEVDPDDIAVPQDASPSAPAEAWERSVVLAKAIDGLSESDAAMIRAIFFEGLGYESISKSTSKSQAALRVALHRALKRLKDEPTLQGLY